MLLIEFLDHACKLDPRARLTVYVDDMGVEATALEQAVIEAIATVLRYLVTIVGKLRMKLSTTKCVGCASNFRVGRTLASAVPGIVLKFQPRVTPLGSPLGAGTRRNTKVA